MNGKGSHFVNVTSVKTIECWSVNNHPERMPASLLP